MMECTEFRTSWSEWQAGELSPAEDQAWSGHARRCAACNAYHQQMQAMLRALDTLPAPGPIPGDLNARLMERARTGDGSSDVSRSRKSVRRPTWGWAMAASLLVAIIGSALVYNPLHLLTRGDTAEVVLSLNQPQKVQLMFDAAQPVAQVEYTIELPAGVEVEGYPGMDVLQWRGRLLAGRNGLALPLVARNSGSEGVLIARIAYDGTQRELRIPVHIQPEPHAQHLPVFREKQKAVSLGWNNARGIPS